MIYITTENNYTLFHLPGTSISYAWDVQNSIMKIKIKTLFWFFVPLCGEKTKFLICHVKSNDPSQVFWKGSILKYVVNSKKLTFLCFKRKLTIIFQLSQRHTFRSEAIFWMSRERKELFRWNKKHFSYLFKYTLSRLKQFLVTHSPFKMMKNAFYFTLEALFILKIFKFLSWFFGHIEKWLD